VEIGPVLAAPDRRDGAEGVVHTTVRLNQVIEGWVRERPEQWLWLSERFRDSPDARAAVAARGFARGLPGRSRRPGSALSVGR
jgi:KDO2-lipid IV(A) lauroyltransferase